MSHIINIHRLDQENIIIHFKIGNHQTTHTFPVAWNTIHSVSIENNQLRIYHSHTQSLYTIDGEVPEIMILSD